MIKAPIVVHALLAASLFAALACALPAQAQSHSDKSAPDTPAASETPPAAPSGSPEHPRGKPRDHGKADAKKAAELPDTPAQRDKMLADLYAQLATAEDAATTKPLIAKIERLWLYYGSDTVGVLMDRSVKAIADKKPDLALQLLDEVVALAPDYAEGWNRRAYVYYGRNAYDSALGDLRRVLALEPNHFKALEGLGQIFKELGQKKAALEAYRRLLAINPNAAGAKDTLDELTHEVEGRGI